MKAFKNKTEKSNQSKDSGSATENRTHNDETLQFVDKRKESIAQKKISDIIDNSPRSHQLKAIKSITGDSPVQRSENKTGLPDDLKIGIENLSGHSLDDVTVHYNSSTPLQLQAHAYAQGSHIHLGPGQEKHLPHEAWHVVQQKQGRVQPTFQLKRGVQINDDISLEREADVMGAKALQFVPDKENIVTSNNIGKPNNNTIQRTMLMSSEATTNPPITKSNLLKWLMKTSSPNVKMLLESPHVTYRIRFDNTLGADGDTSISLQYTDKNAAGGTINLFSPASIPIINGLAYPLQNYTFFITTSVKTGGRLQGSPPIAANAITTWQGILVHEMEAHTGLAVKALENLIKMEKAAKASIPSLKEKITSSMTIRTDDAEHKNLASGNATLAKAQENTILEAATHNEKVDILIDIVTDRVKHIDWFITNADHKKLALRDAKSFLINTSKKIKDLTAGDNTRISALKGWIEAKIV